MLGLELLLRFGRAWYDSMDVVFCWVMGRFDDVGAVFCWIIKT